MKTMGEWISVKDRAPKDSEIVLGFFDPYFASVAYIRECNGFFLPDGMYATVTHWMELPEAPI